MEYINSLYIGRLNRRTYLVSSLGFLIVLGLINSVLNSVLGPQSAISGLVSLVIFIFAAIVGVSLSVRRFHDLGKSGWFSALFLIPVVGFFVWLYLIFAAGNSGSNKYGDQPKDAYELNKAFGMK